MSSVNFLWAAYIATWTIHGLYIVSILRRYRSLRRQMKDLRNNPPGSLRSGS